ncbi:MAG TPA: hypothetical protein VFE85_02350, partial [Woeseiaceae bacterium]|nr:hypothetical protein [Woeseiaceae bacterium]
VRHFDGHADPANGVYRQVWAIWQVLAEHGIRYSSTDPAIERGPYLFTQRVRSLDEIWAGDVANCIDGSVLIASVLQRIGLHSFLVLVPGHAFVGFHTDADERRAAYLETTMLGTNVAQPRRTPAFAMDVVPTPARRRSLAGFVAALAAGHAGYRHAAARLDGRHHPDYAIIDITAARSLGIVPIAEAIDRDRRSP